ncbi:VC2046/SO_2500 family protein [Alteromonas sp. PRIM-21]|uniref:VC2046/SO_2500 family protein n=1 Tax=Alteromonas sp. PRIM-21 TaxID=1454978 RepID=UPI0022B9C4DD|nr:VC2046/SO_2500 family protein [Alteromonas sp. PRIM-21]MCZ8529314.1 hypothetical protein [Alteromonas sp. PRIM-21]
MSPDLSSANEQTTLDPSIYWERSGVLARASSQGALFSLYLAMQQHSVAEPFEIEAATSDADTANSIEAQLAALNHYKRPSLSVSENEWTDMHVHSNLLATDYESARLFLSMKPAPLAQTDDAKRIPDDVVDNCSLATQKRLKKQYDNAIKEDNTLLYDVISSQGDADDGKYGKDKHQATTPDFSSFENIA